MSLSKSARFRHWRGVISAVVLVAATSAEAHRLDEYLQAATLDIEPARLLVELRLTPGKAVADPVLKELDADGDGDLSDGEKASYCTRVLHDVTLTVDNRPAQLRCDSSQFATVEALRAGTGDIVLMCEADLNRTGGRHTIGFENRHHRENGAYLSNCLMPKDPAIVVADQVRSEDQSRYQLSYSWTPPATLPAAAHALPPDPPNAVPPGLVVTMALAMGVIGWMVSRRWRRRRPL